MLALDADRAGADAMIRAQKVAGGKSLELRVAAMPEGEDPADMLKDGSVERFNELVEEAIELVRFQVNQITRPRRSLEPTLPRSGA